MTYKSGGKTVYQPSVDWNPKQNRLREIIRKPDYFDEAIRLCFELHAFVHQSGVSNCADRTLADEVHEDLRDIDYCLMPSAKDVTIAWNLWHITRIEDITMNLLVGDGKQVLDDTWLDKLGTKTTDTGNAMTDEEIIALSKELNKVGLLEYRRAVGMKSRRILSSLQPADMKRKFPQERAEQIMLQGCLAEHPQSIWLKDFWGKKDVAGILLLPLTRHQAGHLNDCLKLKKKCVKIKA